MRLTRLLLPITLLAALALTSSAFANGDVGAEATQWTTWVVESYATELDNDVWHYDYILWYEVPGGTTGWDQTRDQHGNVAELNTFVLSWPEGLGTSGVDDIFVDAGLFEATSGKYSLDSDTDHIQALSDNTDFNGAVASVEWLGWTNNADFRGWVWDFDGNSTVDDGTIDEGLIDDYDTYKEAYDPAVRTVYFHNRPSDSFSDDDLDTAWNTYIYNSTEPIYSTLDDRADAWFPLDSANPGGTSGSWSDTGSNPYKNLGYNRPFVWLWIEFTAPPTEISGEVRDGTTPTGPVLGPTPELNPVFLLMLTLLPAGLLLRKRD